MSHAMPISQLALSLLQIKSNLYLMETEKDHKRSQEGFGLLKISAHIDSHYENTNDLSQTEIMFYFSLDFHSRFSQAYLQCQRHKESIRSLGTFQTVRWGKCHMWLVLPIFFSSPFSDVQETFTSFYSLMSFFPSLPHFLISFSTSIHTFYKTHVTS